MWVLCVVTVEEGCTLLLMSSWEPVSDEVLYLSDIHKLDVVDVSVLLSFDDDVRRDALVAHGLREGLVVAAGAIHIVSHARGRQAVVAFDVSRMDALAFELTLL